MMRGTIYGYCYRTLMKLSHRFNWHHTRTYYPEGDTLVRCEWCGLSSVTHRANAKSISSNILQQAKSAVGGAALSDGGGAALSAVGDAALSDGGSQPVDASTDTGSSRPVLGSESQSNSGHSDSAAPPTADDLVERLKFYAQGIRAGDITSPQFDADIMSEAADTIVAQQHDIDRLVGASSELATENEALRRKVAELKESARKLATLADACSDQVYGGECGWERVDFKEFVKRVRTRLHSAEAAEARISELNMHQSLQDSTTAAVMERAEKAEAEAELTRYECDLIAARTERDALRKDAARLDWMQSKMLAADFDYGERHENVLVIRWPNTPLGANIRSNIDAAMTGSTK